jgi:hypothetical protein
MKGHPLNMQIDHIDHLKNKSDSFMWRQHEPLHEVLERFLTSLFVNTFDYVLTHFYETQMHQHEDAMKQIIFKKNYFFIQHQSKMNLKIIITDIMHQLYISGTLSPISTIIEISLRKHHQNTDAIEVYRRLIIEIETYFNIYIKDMVVYVNTWVDMYRRLKPIAFVIHDECPQIEYLQSCLLHDILCLPERSYKDMQQRHHLVDKRMYHYYQNQSTQKKRWTHIWTYHTHYIQNVYSDEIIQTLDIETMQRLDLHDQNSKKYMLPVPEDLIELETWAYKYLNHDKNSAQKCYLLWLKNDTLLTHFKRIPKNIEVIIDLNVICQEYFDFNPLQTMTYKDFNQYIVPILRDIHQTLRVKKIVHYVYGYALSQPEVYHRCLTLGFRHFIMHRPHLYIALDESLKFMRDYQST